MLFESVTYHGNLPFELSFLNVGEENKHCHKEIEILLVLRGTTHYQIYHTDYELNPGDLIIADLEDLHQIHGSSEDILLLSIHVDTKSFENLYPNIRYMFFVCEECMVGSTGNKQILQSKLALLKHQIARLTLDYAENESNESLLMDDVTVLISILVNHFQGFFMEDYQYKTSQENMNSVDLQRLSRITRYILLNYKEKITLDDVSQMEHLSSYYVSHLIKKTLGFNFQNFVNAIRLEFAEKLLVFSNLTLTQIGQDCGFSSPNYFNKCFSAWHGKTPAEYRKEYHPCERSFKNSFTKDEALAFLIPYLNLSNQDEGNNVVVKKTTIDLALQSCKYENFWDNYSPEILIFSLTDLMKLGYYEGKLKKIQPYALVIDEALEKSSNELFCNSRDLASQFEIPITTSFKAPHKEEFFEKASSAFAFSEILKEKHSEISLTGEGRSLFSTEGLITPFYNAYSFFTGFENPEISVHKHFAAIKTASSLCILMYNTSPHSLMNVHLSTGTLSPSYGLSDKFYLLKREISDNDNCYCAMDAIGSPSKLPSALKNRINDIYMSKTTYSTIDKAETPVLNFIVSPNSVMILEIIHTDAP